ncbi:9111_t:CDS:2, partial [Gigaspora rosea]
MGKVHKEEKNIGNKWEKKDVEDLRGWWKILFIKNSERVEKEKLKQIEENIEKHCQIIDGGQGRILASLLEKLFKCAIIDRIIESSNNSRVLISELLQVKKKQEISSRDNLGKEVSKLKPWEKNGH